MASAWKLLSEAFDDDDDDLTALARRYKTGPSITDLVDDPEGKAKYGASAKKTSGGHTPFSVDAPDDDPASAMKAAGLPPASTKNQQHQQSVNYTKDWMVATRYADQVITINDRKEMAELITTFAAGLQHKRPLSPQLVGRYVGKMLLAHTEDHAKRVLMDLAAEIRGEKDR